jgi:hypothetical protein
MGGLSILHILLIFLIVVYLIVRIVFYLGGRTK